VASKHCDLTPSALQVCYTKGVSAFLPAFLQGRTLLGLLSAPSALVEVVVDSDRHVLYTRSASSVVQARMPAWWTQDAVSS